MGKPKNMEELIQGMDALAMEMEWTPEKSNAVLYLMHDSNGGLYNMFGHAQAMANGILNIMIQDKRFRDIVVVAYKSYIDYEAKKLAPALEPLIRHVDKITQNLSTTQTAESPLCLYSAKFKSRNS